MTNRAILWFALFALVLAFGAAACEALEDEINDATAQTETIRLDLTEDWVPLYAIEQGDYSFNTLCYADTMSIDDLVGATDYADLWDSAKGYIDEIEVQAFESRIRDNITEGGSLDIFLVDTIPAMMDLPGEIDIDEFGIDTVMWRLVDPDALNNNDRIASIDIPETSDVDDWTEASWASGGRQALEDVLLDFDEPFAFCLRLAVPLHSIDLEDLEEDLRLKLRTEFDVTFTPL